MGLVAIQRLLPNFNEIFSAVSTIKSLEKNFLDTIELINLPLDDQTRVKTLNKINFKNSISFRNVDFSYLEKKLILQNINLEI